MEVKEKITSGELELEFVSEYGQNYGVLSLFNSESEEVDLYKEWKDFIGDKVTITIHKIE